MHRQASGPASRVINIVSSTTFAEACNELTDSADYRIREGRIVAEGLRCCLQRGIKLRWLRNYQGDDLLRHFPQQVADAWEHLRTAVDPGAPYLTAFRHNFKVLRGRPQADLRDLSNLKERPEDVELLRRTINWVAPYTRLADLVEGHLLAKDRVLQGQFGVYAGLVYRTEYFERVVNAGATTTQYFRVGAARLEVAQWQRAVTFSFWHLARKGMGTVVFEGRLPESYLSGDFGGDSFKMTSMTLPIHEALALINAFISEHTGQPGLLRRMFNSIPKQRPNPALVRKLAAIANVRP